MRWQDDAVCAQIGPDAFFPDEAGGGTTEARWAKRVCARCPVRVECLEEALATPGMQGIWGGTNEKGRRKIRQERERKASAA